MSNRIKLAALTAVVSAVIPAIMWQLWQFVGRRRETHEYR